jgi:hypothetical protein
MKKHKKSAIRDTRVKRRTVKKLMKGEVRGFLLLDPLFEIDQIG